MVTCSEVWFPGIRRCVNAGFAGSPPYRKPGPKTWAGSRVLANVFNSGRHIYCDPFQSFPNRWYEAYDQPLTFLPFKEYCGVGALVPYGNFHLRHLGHLHGLEGGNAQVEIDLGGWVWRCVILPCAMWRIIEFDGGFQGAFVNYLKMPRPLLSHG